MKKIVFISLLLILGFTAFSTFVIKIPPWYLGSAVETATGLGAKVACSGRYVSGFSDQRIFDDLAVYSPITRSLDLTFDDEQSRVDVSLYGMGSTSAKYREGLGCTLDIGDSSALDAIALHSIDDNNAEWPRGNRISDVVVEQQKITDNLLKRDNTENLDTRALLVVKNGAIMAEAYADEYDENTKFLGWSMGKSITSILIGSMIHQGKITLNDANLFVAWDNDERTNIRVEDLLTMTSGLGFDETYMPGSDSTRMLFAAHSASSVALTSPLVKPPGEYFAYSSGTTNLLSRLVFQRAGNTPQANHDYFAKQILTPLSLRNTIFEVDASGVFVGSSYIYASARDWAKFGLLLLNDGDWFGQRILPEGYVTKMQEANASQNEARYGFQLWLNSDGIGNEDANLRWPNLPADAYMMNGNRSQLVLIIPSLSTVVVRLGWTPGRYPSNEKFARLLSLD